MNSTDLEVLNTALQWLDGGRRVTLATVVETWGSSPRPPGAWAVIRDNGAIAGSVSGGCVEDDLAQRARERPAGSALPEIVNYGVNADEAARFGLPCGGRLRLVLEPAPDAAQLRALQSRIEAREVVARTLEIESGRASLSRALRTSRLQFDGKRLTTIHGPRWRLLIIGAGQASRYLAQMARALDYQVIVCDPREEYRAGWDVEGVDLVTAMPDDTVLELQLDACSAVVALTHDPKLDDMALLEALKSPAFYVGALGSRANNARRKKRLQQHFDLTAEEIARLHGPVGLAIGSRTPPEIAVSILAELIALRNGIAAPEKDALPRSVSGCAS
jgi:xanthine dehydrogenase accessory factor